MIAPRVVIVGGGFGGLSAAKKLRRAPVEVTLLDRSNHHLFQPLLYQVAMAGLSPAEIAMPIRRVLRNQPNALVLLEEVTAIDVAARTVTTRNASFPYDYLVVATGAVTNYFGHPEWERFTLGLKSIDEAVEIRRHVLLAFERAERETDAARRRAMLQFVVIGGGPTGVELAGALAELARFVLARDFVRVQAREAKVTLLEAGPALLPHLGEELSQAARAQLELLGVEVRTSAKVTAIDESTVELGDDRLAASLVIWAAGVAASPLARELGVPLDRAGRVIVESDASIPGHPEVFVIGDMAAFHQDGALLPGVSPVAMQQARHVARTIRRELAGQPRTPFRY